MPWLPVLVKQLCSLVLRDTAVELQAVDVEHLADVTGQGCDGGAMIREDKDFAERDEVLEFAYEPIAFVLLLVKDLHMLGDILIGLRGIN